MPSVWQACWKAIAGPGIPRDAHVPTSSSETPKDVRITLGWVGAVPVPQETYGCEKYGGWRSPGCTALGPEEGPMVLWGSTSMKMGMMLKFFVNLERWAVLHVELH